MSWQWWVAQSFAFVGLAFVIISFQQKNLKKLMWLRNIATINVFTGLCFLGETSAIIMCGAGVVRNAVSLIFAYKPETKIYWKYVAGGFIICALIALNIVFWKDYYNIFSIVTGAFNVITFMQNSSKRVRIFSVIAEILLIVYFSLLLSPINITIEVVSLISAVVGIIRLDIKKKTETEVNENANQEIELTNKEINVNIQTNNDEQRR